MITVVGGMLLAILIFLVLTGLGRTLRGIFRFVRVYFGLIVLAIIAALISLLHFAATGSNFSAASSKPVWSRNGQHVVCIKDCR